MVRYMNQDPTHSCPASFCTLLAFAKCARSKGELGFSVMSACVCVCVCVCELDECKELMRMHAGADPRGEQQD